MIDGACEISSTARMSAVHRLSDGCLLRRHVRRTRVRPGPALPRPACGRHSPPRAGQSRAAGPAAWLKGSTGSSVPQTTITGMASASSFSRGMTPCRSSLVMAAAIWTSISIWPGRLRISRKHVDVCSRGVASGAGHRGKAGPDFILRRRGGVAAQQRAVDLLAKAARRQKRQRGDAVGVGERHQRSHGSAHRMADKMRPVDASCREIGQNGARRCLGRTGAGKVSDPPWPGRS